ncbi:GNAT family N-acetyltransferase [Noviherbaspirillum pedocola]|uniref:GNAT family N-acetyltransferase n=1 Tax=Noviherbaspirillum pedocola TaxID=2801341 RepID=A0A934T1F6_9BURK|nr:GNAT family N-acetyltransferase [Noviherbaspirillum pedocola]MBK4737237.1 GNAT family N-acetyltransferase [Noviherbaspirillum pedocola]
MRLRRAGAGDAEAIVGVQVAAWRAAYAGLMPQDFLDAMDHPRRLESWRRALSMSGPQVFTVAEDESGTVAGFCVCGPSRDADANSSIGEIIALNVLPSAWRQGIGRLLCEDVIALAPERGWQTLTLWVLRDNARARSAYARIGFEADGTRKVETALTGTPLVELRYRREGRSA